MSELNGLITLDDFERRARERIPPAHLEYIAGGCADNCGVVGARSAFARYLFVPRVLCGVGPVRDTSVRFFCCNNCAASSRML